MYVCVVGALVKTDEQEVINFLLTTEIIPLCLRIMETGSELSKTVPALRVAKRLMQIMHADTNFFRREQISCCPSLTRVGKTCFISAGCNIHFAEDPPG